MARAPERNEFPQAYNDTGNELDMDVTLFVRETIGQDRKKQLDARRRLIGIEDSLDLVDRAEATNEPLLVGIVAKADAIRQKYGYLTGAQVWAVVDNLKARLDSGELFVDSPWWPQRPQQPSQE